MEFGEHFDYKNLGIEDLCRIALESFGSQSNAAFSIFVNKNCLEALCDCSRNGDVAGPVEKHRYSEFVVQHHCSTGVGMAVSTRRAWAL